MFGTTQQPIPKWVVWMCPLCAATGAAVLGLLVVRSGFWGTFLIAIVSSLLPLAAHRLYRHLRPRA